MVSSSCDDCGLQTEALKAGPQLVKQENKSRVSLAAKKSTNPAATPMSLEQTSKAFGKVEGQKQHPLDSSQEVRSSARAVAPLWMPATTMRKLPFGRKRSLKLQKPKTPQPPGMWVRLTPFITNLQQIDDDIYRSYTRVVSTPVGAFAKGVTPPNLPSLPPPAARIRCQGTLAEHRFRLSREPMALDAKPLINLNLDPTRACRQKSYA